jgi:predicted GH43/DUF377 family glycosyl hydrolase
MAGNMVNRISDKLLLTPENFEPTRDDFRIVGVFNPGAERFGDEIVLLVRVAQGVKAERKGYLYSPRNIRRDGDVEYEIDCLKVDPSDDGDHRKRTVEGGKKRLAFVSHLELVRISPDGYEVTAIERLDDLFGGNEFEEYGVEDARITKIEDTYYITYVSVSGSMGVATSLMSTKDFRSFERHGIIFPCENKDVVIFPEKVGGMYWCYHRPVGRIQIARLAIVAASSPDMCRWGGHELVLGSAAQPGWYDSRVGAGTPPVRTDAGWLSIFHGVRAEYSGDPIGIYTAGAMLTDIDNPGRLIAVSSEPFFRAEADYEVKGYVGNVVFPTGIVTDMNDSDRAHIYYGCADSCIAVATYSISDILGSLKNV